uniref:Dynein light chain n=1 Tax=Schistosoma japonicum TaxID=6182 RepID=C1L664_SCHJA|nr:adenosinetriphosphatase [Schistosoma japonicum]
MDEPETARIKSTDMSESMQSIAVDCCAAACERFKEERDIAKYIKNEFDKRYGGTWQCVVGNFGCYVTHKKNHFIYFHLYLNAVLLYQADEKQQQQEHRQQHEQF